MEKESVIGLLTMRAHTTILNNRFQTFITDYYSITVAENMQPYPEWPH